MKYPELLSGTMATYKMMAYETSFSWYLNNICVFNPNNINKGVL
jgi:hypothetical protein